MKIWSTEELTWGFSAWLRSASSDLARRLFPSGLVSTNKSAQTSGYTEAATEKKTSKLIYDSRRVSWESQTLGYNCHPIWYICTSNAHRPNSGHIEKNISLISAPYLGSAMSRHNTIRDRTIWYKFFSCHNKIEAAYSRCFSNAICNKRHLTYSLTRFCHFSEGISSTIFSIIPTPVSLHGPSMSNSFVLSWSRF